MQTNCKIGQKFPICGSQNFAKNFKRLIFRYKNSLFDRKIVQYYKDYRTVWYNIFYALIFVSEFDFSLFAIACSASSPAPESLKSIFRNDVFRSMPDERDCPPSNPIVFDTFHELSKLST